MFCAINPLYKKVIKQLFEEKHRKDVEALFDLNPDGFKGLIKKFQNLRYKEEHIFNIAYCMYNNRYSYTPVIKHELYELGEFIDTCNIQFYIPEHYYPLICEKMGAEIRSCVLGNYSEE